MMSSTNKNNMVGLIFYDQRDTPVHLVENNDSWIVRSIVDVARAPFAEELRSKASDFRNISLSEQAFRDIFEAICDRIEMFLEPSLQPYYDRMVDSLNVSQETKEKATKTIRTRFVMELRNGVLDDIFRNNPHLYNTLNEIVTNWFEDFMETLQRCSDDARDIAHKLTPATTDSGRMPLHIIGYIDGLSDRHNKGRTVKILTLQNRKKAVYKPRSLGPEEIFYGICSKYAEFTNADAPKVPWTIDRQSYGWMEYLQSEEISRYVENKSNLRNIGTLSSVWYVLGGTDLHDENIIYTKEGPVILDCETLFEADFFYPRDGKEPHYEMEPFPKQHTILSTRFLDATLPDKEDEEAKVSSAGIARLLRYYEDKDRQKYRADDLKLVLEGFAKSIDYFGSLNRAQFTELFLDPFKGRNLTTRIVLRHTGNYIILLGNLGRNYHIAKVAHAPKDYVNEQLAKASPPNLGLIDSEEIKAAETEQLIAFDVPYFKRAFDKASITSSNGFTFGYDQDINFISSYQRFTWLKNRTFRQQQIDTLQIVLFPETFTMGKRSLSTDDNVFKEYFTGDTLSTGTIFRHIHHDPDLYLKTLADKLHARLKDDNGYSDNPIVCHYKKNNVYEMKLRGTSLFQGIAGELLFLGAYAFVHRDSEKTDFVVRKLNDFVDMCTTQRYALHGNIGIEAGLNSILYVAEFVRSMGVEGIRSLEGFTDQLERTIKSRGNNYDLLYGASGLSILHARLLEGGQRRDEDSVKGMLREGRQHMLAQWEAIPKKQKDGMAHGVLGICLATLAQNDMSKKDLDELLYIIERYGTEKQTKQNSTQPGSWCYGGAGEAVLHTQLAAHFNDSSFLNKSRQLADTNNELAFTNHSLCCGTAGYFIAHLKANQLIYANTSPEVLIQKYLAFVEYSVSDAKGTAKPSPRVAPQGLFYGELGIALVLLYCKSLKNIPNVLALEFGHHIDR